VVTDVLTLHLPSADFSGVVSVETETLLNGAALPGRV